MTPDFALGLGREMLWTALLLSAPVIGVSLVVGLVISILQAVTQIQEMTLTFVPKLLAIFVVFLVLGSWMLSVMIQYAATTIGNIPTYFH